MRFGTNHAFQLAPGRTVGQVYEDEFARIHYAEQLGYHYVWLPEQHLFDYCVCPDALDLAAHAVARTSRVRVGAAVVNPSLTHPLRFAERIAMLDLISDGRVDVCVGRGYQLPQNVAFGVAEEHTKPMFDEALDIVLNTWHDGPRGYDGAHYAFPPALHASSLAGEDVERLLDRAFVLVYALVAPTAHEAQDIRSSHMSGIRPASPPCGLRFRRRRSGSATTTPTSRPPR